MSLRPVRSVLTTIYRWICDGTMSKSIVAKDLHGFMLCTPNGAPVMWTDTRARALSCFALVKRGGFPVANNVNLESELVAVGWKILPCAISATMNKA